MAVRLYHPTARSTVAVFEHHKRPYRTWNRTLRKRQATPMWCPVCTKFHAVKTYHVVVDSDGFAIVSDPVWKMMKRHTTAGFQLANEVTGKPPTIVIGGELSRPRITELGD